MAHLHQPLTFLIKLFPLIDQNTNLEPADHVNLGKLFDVAKSIRNRIFWLEKEPLTADLGDGCTLLFEMFKKLDQNKILQIGDKNEIEKLLINIKWFCEKLEKSSDKYLTEPMDID